MPKYIVTITTDPIGGSNMAVEEYFGRGASYLHSYLNAKMPAGSPVTIEAVEHCPQNFHIGFGSEEQS